MSTQGDKRPITISSDELGVLDEPVAMKPGRDWVSRIPVGYILGDGLLIS
jgi:hypothetical protein